MKNILFSALLLLLCPLSLALYGSNTAVDIITSKDDFKNRVTKSDDLVFVEFFAPWCGHCKNLAPEWEKAAKALSGVVKLAAVDATIPDLASLAQKYGVQGYPTIKAFSGKGSNPTDYQGPRDAKGIVAAALKEVNSLVNGRMGGKKESKSSKPAGGNEGSKKKKGSDKDVVITLTDADFDEVVLQSNDVWMVEFYAPWCGHCKNLAPHWKAAAQEMEGRVKFGMVDATQEQGLASRFEIKGFPTIKYFGGGPKSAESAKNYEQARETDALVNFATRLSEESGIPPAPIEIKQLTDASVLDAQCEGKQICVIAFLPNILDTGAAGRRDYLDKLEKAASTAKRNLFTFSWSEGGAQKALEVALKVSSADYPAVVALNRGKGKFSKHRGAFSDAALKGFITGMISGRSSVLSLPDELPAVVKVTAWDGKDGKVEVEEEFSLDDIMGEEL